MKKNDLSVLLSINDDIATIKDDKELFLEIFRKLHIHYNLRIGGLSLFTKNKDRLGFVVTSVKRPDDLENPSLWIKTFSTEALPSKLLVEHSKISIIGSSFFHNFPGIRNNTSSLTQLMKEMDINSFFFIPMKTAGEHIGFLLLQTEESALSIDDNEHLIKIANLIAATIHNATAYEELQKKEKQKDMQLNLLSALVIEKENTSLSVKLAEEIEKLISCEYLAFLGQVLNDDETITDRDAVFIPCFMKEKGKKLEIRDTTPSIRRSLIKLASAANFTGTFNHYELVGEKFQEKCLSDAHLNDLRTNYGIKSILILQYRYQGVGELTLLLGRTTRVIEESYNLDMIFLSNSDSYFIPSEINLGIQLLPQIGLILANVFAFEEIRILTEKLKQQKNYLLEEVNLTNSFQEIIGNSKAIQITLSKVQQVAPLSSTVLILGETGTGKELIAKAIHNLSERKDNAFITVNCAALPAQLIESELFGHEKGSFTGAIEKKLGKFEAADGGTIFLDEIGELPLEIQAKLLRVLQEKEFERLGGKSTIYSDVRIIAATNRDLEKEIAEGKFRTDLYFRLNVFPIVVPTLRERSEDIPMLVKHFIQKYSKRIGKEVQAIGKADLEKLVKYNWPGNIRELEHTIERAIIISDGFNIDLSNFVGGDLRADAKDIESFKPLVELEKEHIVNALKLANGKVTGENSAAQLLGLNGKTLGSKMRKFGIKREIVITS